MQISPEGFVVSLLPEIRHSSDQRCTPVAFSTRFWVVVLSRVRLWATLWTVAHQAPWAVGFPRQEHWGGLPFPPPGDLSDPGIKTASLALGGGFFTTEPPGKPQDFLKRCDIKAALGKQLGFSSALTTTQNVGRTEGPHGHPGRGQQRPLQLPRQAPGQGTHTGCKTAD